jgi:hypothetical protein
MLQSSSAPSSSSDIINPQMSSTNNYTYLPQQSQLNLENQQFDYNYYNYNNNQSYQYQQQTDYYNNNNYQNVNYDTSTQAPINDYSYFGQLNSYTNVNYQLNSNYISNITSPSKYISTNISTSSCSSSSSSSTSESSITETTNRKIKKATKLSKKQKLKLEMENNIDESNSLLRFNSNETVVTVELTNLQLWSKFNEHTTEMIITKQGRRMFPTLQYSIKGLIPNRKYNVFVDIVLWDENNWKFQGGKWVPCGPAQPQLSGAPINERHLKTQQIDKNDKTRNGRVYYHPDSPHNGSFWMKNEICFSKLKLSNNKQTDNKQQQQQEGHLLLNSMHKYLPRIHIVPCDDQNDIKTFYFNETKFIAVTAYQNTDVNSIQISKF